MAAKNDVTVDIKGKSSTSAAAQKTNQDVNSIKSTSTSATQGIKTGWIEATAAVYAAVKAWDKLMSVATELSDAFKVQAEAEGNLKSVLTATGNAAGFTAQELFKQAAALQEVTKVGDETILAAQGILATFRNVAGTSFSRTIKSALDLSRVLKTDLNSQVLQLGKALNDPTTGLTALTRVGITFTDEQEDLIASLVESNDLLGAQDIILAEIENQVGGAAEAYGALSIAAGVGLANSVGDLKEAFGELITEQLAPLQTFIADIIQWFTALDPKIKALILGIGEFIAISATVLITLASIKLALALLIPILQSAGIAISGLLGPIGLVIAAVGIAVAVFGSLGASMKKIGEEQDEISSNDKAINTLLENRVSVLDELVEGNTELAEIDRQLEAGEINILEATKARNEIGRKILAQREQENILDAGRADIAAELLSLQEAAKDLPAERLAAVQAELVALEELRNTSLLTTDEAARALELQILLEEEKRKIKIDQLNIDLLGYEQQLERINILDGINDEEQANITALNTQIKALQKQLGILEDEADVIEDIVAEESTLVSVINDVIAARQEQADLEAAVHEAMLEMQLAVIDGDYARIGVLTEAIAMLREMLGITEEIASVEPQIAGSTTGEDFISSLGLNVEGLDGGIASTISELVTGFGDLGGAMDPILAIVLAMTEYAPNILALLNPMSTVLQGFAETIGPQLNNLLSPLVGLLYIVGQTIALVLGPAISFLIPIVQTVSDRIIDLYNRIIVPVGNAIATILDYIFQIVSKTLDGIFSVINAFITGINNLIAKIAPNADQIQTLTLQNRELGDYEQITPISFDTALAASDYDYDSGDYESSQYSGTTTVQRVPDIYITMNIEGNVIGPGMEQIGEFMIEAIQEYAGAGGNVTIIQGEG